MDFPPNYFKICIISLPIFHDFLEVMNCALSFFEYVDFVIVIVELSKWWKKYLVLSSENNRKRIIKIVVFWSKCKIEIEQNETRYMYVKRFYHPPPPQKKPQTNNKNKQTNKQKAVYMY